MLKYAVGQYETQRPARVGEVFRKVQNVGYKNVANSAVVRSPEGRAQGQEELGRDVDAKDRRDFASTLVI